MFATLAASLLALCLCAHAACAGVVEQYEASSDNWRAVAGGGRVDDCAALHSYDEMMADIDLALIKGQLLLLRPTLHYVDLGEQERRELRAFYGRLDQARGAADQRCRR